MKMNHENIINKLDTIELEMAQSADVSTVTMNAYANAVELIKKDLIQAAINGA